MPRLIDVHTHMQFAAYDTDRDAVIRRALDAGIWMINVGTQRDTSANSCELAHRYEGVFATVGLHPIHTEKSYHDEKELGIISESEREDRVSTPHTPLPARPAGGLTKEGGDGGRSSSSASGVLVKGFASRGEEFDYDYYKKLAQDPKVFAIGECGLDYYRLTEGTKNKQAEVFIKQIELAHEVGKPLMIHCREAFADLIDILTSNLTLLISPPGVIHFFSGTIEDARRLMDLEFSFSFGGVITFARAYEKLIKFIPIGRILLETDAPYVAPQAYRGRRNEPLYVEEVAQKIAKIKNISFEEIAHVTTENAIRIFNLKQNPKN